MQNRANTFQKTSNKMREFIQKDIINNPMAANMLTVDGTKLIEAAKMACSNGKKKYVVYVKNPKTGNVKKVNFGHGGSSVKGKSMKIRKNNPAARRSFRARHNCDNPGPRTKARYWSCRKW